MPKVSGWTKNLIALVLVALLLALVDPLELWHALSNITWELLGLLLLLSVLLVYISALKWQLFLEANGQRVSALHLFNLYVVGYFVNLLAPSYVGGDAVRSWYAGKKVGQHEAFAATILERYTGFVAMVVMALIFVWAAAGVTFEIKLAILAAAAGLVLITILGLSGRVLSLFGRIKMLERPVGHLQKVQVSLHAAKNRPVLLAKALALSFLFHSFTVVNTIAAAHAVGWFTASASEIFVVLPLIMLIGALPVAPAGLGIQEGAFYYFLQAIGANASQALGVGVVLRAKSYLLALCGGLIWLKIRSAPRP